MRADHLYVIPACPRCFGQAEKTGRRKRWTCVACGQQWIGEPKVAYCRIDETFYQAGFFKEGGL